MRLSFVDIFSRSSLSLDPVVHCFYPHIHSLLSSLSILFVAFGLVHHPNSSLLLSRFIALKVCTLICFCLSLPSPLALHHSIPFCFCLLYANWNKNNPCCEMKARRCLHPTHRALVTILIALLPSSQASWSLLWSVLSHHDDYLYPLSSLIN